MRSEKLHLVKYIGTLLTDSDYVYFISYQGLKVKEFSVLRNKLAEVNGECHVLKNALILKAAELSGVSAVASANLTQSTALICGKGDASAAAKIITEFGKTNQAAVVKGGMVEGMYLSVADVDAIASMPSKDVLRAMLLGVLQAPAQNLVGLLNAKAATILNVLNAYKEKLENN